MYATAVTASLIAAALAAVVHFLFVGRRAWRGRSRSGATVVRMSGAERAIHAVAGIAFLTLAVTGLGGVVRQGELGGWWLLGHTVAGPIFAVALAAMAVRWSDRARFRAGDGAWIRRGGGFAGRAAPAAGRFDAGQKIFFWCLVALGLASLASLMATTVPVFGQVGQGRLLAVHRWSGLGITVLVGLHLYVTAAARPGTLRAMFDGKVDMEWARRYHAAWLEELGREGKDPHARS